MATKQEVVAQWVSAEEFVHRRFKKNRALSETIMQTKTMIFRATSKDNKVYILEHLLGPRVAAYELRTISGELVKRLDKGKYIIVRTWEELSSEIQTRRDWSGIPSR